MTRRELVARIISLRDDLSQQGLEAYAKILSGMADILEEEKSPPPVTTDSPSLSGWPDTVAMVDLMNQTEFRLTCIAPYIAPENDYIKCRVTQGVLIRGFNVSSKQEEVQINLDGEFMKVKAHKGYCALRDNPPNHRLFLACAMNGRGEADMTSRLGIFLTNGSMIKVHGIERLDAALYGCEERLSA